MSASPASSSRNLHPAGGLKKHNSVLPFRSNIGGIMAIAGDKAHMASHAVLYSKMKAFHDSSNSSVRTQLMSCFFLPHPFQSIPWDHLFSNARTSYHAEWYGHKWIKEKGLGIIFSKCSSNSLDSLHPVVLHRLCWGSYAATKEIPVYEPPKAWSN